MEKDILLFDLDGTLTDPMVGITKSVQYALRHYGIIEEDLTRLIPFIRNTMDFQRSRQAKEFWFTGNISAKKGFLRIKRFRESGKCWRY